MEPYIAHEAKIKALELKRTKPFDESVLRAVDSAADLASILVGDMQLPDEVEGRIWMTIAGEVMEAGGKGIEFDNVEWTLLDMILAVANKTDEFPVLLLVEIMIASDVLVVSIRGRPVHAGQLYNVTYEGWSRMDDLKERARHHFKFGFLLFSIEEVPRGAEQLMLARQCDPTSSATDLLRKILAQAGGAIQLPDGTTITAADLEENAGARAPAARAAESETAPSVAAEANPVKPPKAKKRIEAEETSSSSFGVMGVIAAVAVVGIAAGLFLKIRGSRR